MRPPHRLYLMPRGGKTAEALMCVRTVSACAQAIKNKGLERSLKMPIPKEVYDTLTKEMEKFETR